MLDSRRKTLYRLMMAIACVLAGYLLAALCYLNRLTWLFAHQGRLLALYWLVFGSCMTLGSTLAWDWLVSRVSRGALGGVGLGYAASVIAGETMYFGLGVSAPITTLVREARNFGLLEAITTVTIDPLVTGGFIVGLFVGLLLVAVAQRRWRILVLLMLCIVAVQIVAVATNPRNHRGAHIQF